MCNLFLFHLQKIQQFSKKEIEDLLRKGAYAAIMDENDEGSRFCEEDIDQILSRRATTITIESEGKGSTFSKASFVASENRNDIALDDPEFWQKWAKKADIDMDSINQKVNLMYVCDDHLIYNAEWHLIWNSLF